jgi:hypothetical protein
MSEGTMLPRGDLEGRVPPDRPPVVSGARWFVTLIVIVQ